MKRWWSAGVGLVAAFVLAMPAGADMINGGFEAGLTGWTANGTVFVTASEPSRDFLAPVDPPWAPAGGQAYAALLSTDNQGTNASSLSRTFSGSAGDLLSFDYFFDFGDLATAPDAATAVLTWWGGSQILFEHNTPGHALANDQNIGWTNLSMTLSASGSYTLSFLITDGPGVFESMLGVDQVSITHAVPAPGAALLGAIGLGLVSWLRRRLTSAGE